MKKSYFAIKWLSPFLIILMIFSTSSSVTAWNDCPFGKTNDTYPGDCPRYVDTDGDGICDLSEPPPEERTESNNQNDANETADITYGGDDSASQKQAATSSRTNYYFLPILAIFVILYGISLLLVKKKKITLAHHRKLWNFLLLITFFISGFLGILLVLKTSNGLDIPYYSAALFWHVEFGIAMAVISIFHILWHRKYFLKLPLKKLFFLSFSKHI